MRFDASASRYHVHATVQRRLAKWCAEWLEPHLREVSAFEFGSGPGIFTAHLVARGCLQLTASDISPRMVFEAKRRLPQVKFQVADAWSPPLMRVDRIYSTSLLQWAREPSEVLATWRSRLRPGGRMLHCMFIAGSLRELLAHSPALSAVDFRTEHNWLEHFNAAGLTVKRWDTWHDTLYFPSAVAALRSVHVLGACAEERASPTDLRRQLERYGKNTSTAYGVPLSWRALRVEASVE